MTRRLLGYVVKLPDGTRSPNTPKPVPLGFELDSPGSYTVPVFSKPKPAELKPAPVVAAEGRYAVLQDGGTPAGFFPMRECPMDSDTTSTRDEAIGRVARMRATDNRRSTYEVVRILADGAHEAALAAAREEGRRDARWGMLTILRDLLRRCPDTEVEGVKAALSALESKSVGGAAK